MQRELEMLKTLVTNFDFRSFITHFLYESENVIKKVITNVSRIPIT